MSLSELLKKMNRWIKWIIKCAEVYDNPELVDKVLKSKEPKKALKNYFLKENSNTKRIKNRKNYKDEDFYYDTWFSWNKKYSYSKDVRDIKINKLKKMKKATDKKKWWKSKTKWAGILTGVGMALPGIISWLNGDGLEISQIWAGAVTILAVFGIRDLPFINK